MRAVRGRVGRVLGVLVVVALVALVAVPASGATALGAAPGRRADLSEPVYNLTIRATSPYGYLPDTIANLPLSTTINVTFVDDSPLPHSFNISSREGVEIVNYSSTNAAELDRILFSAPPLYAAYVTGLADVSVGSFVSPATPGWYEFVCNVSGHFELGMFGYVAFGEALPGNLTLPPSGAVGGPRQSLLPAEVIAGVVGVLIVLASLLVRLRRTARDRELEETDTASPLMPPQPPPP